jgi:predicted nuclease of predicted toxin-antitoxin system
MRLLLDESLPRRLSLAFEGHDVATVPEMGWSGKENGELLTLARSGFDVFVTADQNLRYQQRLTEADIPVVVMAASTTRVADLIPLMPRVLLALARIRSGEVVTIEA